MPYGIDPKGFFISFCFSMCHMSLFPSFSLVPITIHIHTSQVCPKLLCCCKLIPFCCLLVLTVRVTIFSFCVDTLTSNTPPLILLYDTALRFILNILLLCLVVFRTTKQSVELYKATKLWQPNRYLQQFAADGIFYFLMYVPLNICSKTNYIYLWISEFFVTTSPI